MLQLLCLQPWKAAESHSTVLAFMFPQSFIWCVPQQFLGHSDHVTFTQMHATPRGWQHFTWLAGSYLDFKVESGALGLITSHLEKSTTLLQQSAQNSQLLSAERKWLWSAQLQTGHLHHSPPSRLRDHFQREGRRIVRAEDGEN